MTRGGRTKTREDPERRCIVRGESGSTDDLIRFVVGPDDTLVPDIAEKLPGRGIWITADRADLEKALKKKLFARAARQAVTIPDGLVGLVEQLLRKRAVETISMARKAGRAVAGAQKCREAAGSAVLLIQASDGADGGKRKMRGQIGPVPEFNCLTSEELGLAFGRDSVIHAVLTQGGVTQRVKRALSRLQGLRRGEDLEDRPAV